MIRMDDLTVTYPGGVTALSSVSITFRVGEFTVLLGPSGSGKSTLLRCLNCMVKFNSGQLTVEGISNLHDGRLLRQHRRRTAMIFQQHQLIGRQSALKNVLIGRLGYHSSLRSLLPLPKRELLFAIECLERVGLLHKAMERADKLSGGEQQRVGIARALAQKPQIILADEPIASLDPSSAMAVLSLLHDVCKEDGISAIVSLHQVEMARKFADRIVGLAAGRIVFEGRGDELTQNTLDLIYNNGGFRSGVPSDSPSTTGANSFPGLAAIQP
jgi:phosphonate transport system ATP-binding protein